MAVYADVIVDITNEKLDRTFQYRVPEEMEESIVPGVEVDTPSCMMRWSWRSMAYMHARSMI